MEDRGPTPFDRLVPYEKIGKIKIPRFSGMSDKYAGLHCVLVDEKEQAIEASSDEMNYDIIVPKIEAGACYEIMNFRTNKIRGQYQVVLHDTHLVLTAKTVFNKLTSVFLPILCHRFFLQDYNRLYPRLNKTDILIDVIGHVDDTFLCKASIKRFNTSYEWWYAACPTCAKQMYKDPTIGQLIYKVFLVLEDETNEINALIIGKSGEKVFGMPCKDLVYNQRSTDHKQLPSEFFRLIGQRKIFHLWYGSRRNLLNSNDLLIYNVSEDTMIQPTTPVFYERNCNFHRPLHQLKKPEKRTRGKEIPSGEPFLQRLKTGRTQCTRLPLYAGSGRGECRLALPPFMERLLPSLEPETYRSWAKALAIAPSATSC
ncbi:hypothetical protein DVH24_025645 [Malus domestica]|uniref:Replication factor A C-terminal domain-containing protein n=1 Tax=Malus domestica TaxID=3750 RepID=A0A498KEB1_MALDO|nr:hypothetical protein DVH24_025645 [Malus domestica]